MASAAPNTAVPLPAATATSTTIGVAAPPVNTMHAAPVAISTAPPTVLQIPCVFACDITAYSIALNRTLAKAYF